jgi:YbbR domain-containing protein
MLRWLGTNLRTLLLAFALALAVWVSAVTSADPDQTRQFPNPIRIEFIGQDPGLVTMGAIPQSVELTLRAPRSVWEKLTGQENAVRIVADLTGLAAGTHSVHVQVQVGLRPVRVLSVTPENFDIFLEPLVTRKLPIELSVLGDPAIGYRSGDVTLDPLDTLVSGPETIVNRLAHVTATLDLTGARQDINTSIRLIAADAQGAVLTGINLHPETVQVILPVVQMGGYRDLAVKVVTYGRPASGYRLTSISPTPAVVTVFSEDPALINALPGYLETSALDLSGANADIEKRLALILPPGVSVVGDPTVLVQISISPIQSSLTLTNRTIVTVNLGNGLQVRIAPERVDVILTGPLPALNALSLSDLRVVLDLKDLGTGTYHLTPQVELSIQGIVVESILPGTVEVVISYNTTPTP